MADITITEGDTLEVDYNLENTGDGTGTFDPRLLVQGTQEDQDTGITLDPAQTATGTLQWPTESGDAVTNALAEALTDDTSDSILVTVESAIPDSAVDTFERGDLSPYGGSTGSYSVNTNAPVNEGSYSLKFPTDTSNRFIGSVPGDGLPYYPEVGVPHILDIYAEGTGDFDNRSNPAIYFGHSSRSEPDDGYQLLMNYGDTSGTDNRFLRLGRIDGGSFTELNSQTMSLPEQSFYQVEVLHESDGTITARALDGGSEIDRVTATDSTHLTDGEYNNRGLGFTQSRATNDAADNWRTNPDSSLV